MQSDIFTINNPYHFLNVTALNFTASVVNLDKSIGIAAGIKENADMMR